MESKIAFTAVEDCIIAVINAPISNSATGSKNAGLISILRTDCKVGLSFSAPLHADIMVKPKNTSPNPAAVKPQLLTLPFLQIIETNIPIKAKIIK